MPRRPDCLQGIAKSVLPIMSISDAVEEALEAWLSQQGKQPPRRQGGKAAKYQAPLIIKGRKPARSLEQSHPLTFCYCCLNIPNQHLTMIKHT